MLFLLMIMRITRPKYRPFLSSVKALYPDRELTAIFQPHLFSRTRDFAEGFAESLSLADHVILLDIYPARELPMEGVTSDLIFRTYTRKPRKNAPKLNCPTLCEKRSHHYLSPLVREILTNCLTC